MMTLLYPAMIRVFDLLKYYLAMTLLYPAMIRVFDLLKNYCRIKQGHC
jgi:hypothetical protein